jgi:hypothetical protein
MGNLIVREYVSILLASLLVIAVGISHPDRSDAAYTHAPESAQLGKDAITTAHGIEETIYSTDYDSLNTVVSAAGSRPTTLVVSGPLILTGNCAVPSTLSIQVLRAGTIVMGTSSLNLNGPVDLAGTIAATSGNLTCNGSLIVNNGKINVSSGAITINGPFTAGLSRVFTGSGAVSFGSAAVTGIYPQWWGTSEDTWTTAIECARRNRNDIQSSIPVLIPNGTYKLTGPIKLQGVELIGSNAVIIHDNTGGKPLFHVAATDTATIPYERTSIKGFSFKSINGTADCIRIGNSYDDEPRKSVYLGNSNIEIANNSWNAYSGNAINIYKGESISIHHNSFHTGINGNCIKSNGALEGDGHYGYYANSVNITENRFSSHDRFTGGTHPCMLLDGDTIKISNNIIIGNTGKAIVLGTLSNSYAISVSNNYMEQNGAAHIEAGLTSGPNIINSLEITGNRLFGGTTDGAMNHAIALNSVYGVSIRDNFINNSPPAAAYYGYTSAPIQAAPARCRNVEILNNATVDDDINRYIDAAVRYIPRLVVKHYGAYGDYRLDGTSFTETKAASLTPNSRFDLKRPGTYQVDVLCRANGGDGNNNAVGSWMVFFDYKATNPIASAQAIVPIAKTGTVTDLAMTTAKAGSALSLYVTCTQTRKTTARFEWTIKMIAPYN